MIAWRTSADEPPKQWRRYATKLAPDEVVGDMRRRLAPLCGSTAALASVHEPELWQCDEEGNVVARLPEKPEVILRWTATTSPPQLLSVHANGEPRAVLLFTFPSAEATAEPAAKSLRLEATTVSAFKWATNRACAREFFQRLDDAATLQPDANGYLNLPQHPSMAMSKRLRFDAIMDPLGPTTVPLLSRSLARQYETAMLEQCSAYHNYLYIHGAQGAGKSHALYEAVCRLMAQRDKVRVIYLHDCSAWTNELVPGLKYMADVVASGFSPDDEAEVWTAAAAVRDYPGLERLLSIVVPEYCRQRNLKIIALFDQHNGLTEKSRAHLPWNIPERVLPTLASWKGIGATVISASANNDYYLDVALDASWRRLECLHGFTGEELALWRRHHHFFDGPEHAAAWHDVTAAIANWPLDLNGLRRNQRSTLAETLKEHRNARRSAFGYHEHQHITQHITDPDDREAYDGVLVDMLKGRCNITTRFPQARRMINKHILYYEASDDSVRPIHELARQFYFAKLRYKHITGAVDLSDVIIKI